MSIRRKDFFRGLRKIILVLLLASILLFVAEILKLHPKTNPSSQTSLSPEHFSAPSTPSQLLYRRIITLTQSDTKSQVSRIYLYDFNQNKNKLLFTDEDEDFTLKNVLSVDSQTMYIFATPLNENKGNVWKITLDGTGKKEEVLDNFSTISAKIQKNKIVFIVFDEEKSKYQLYQMNLDGKYKKLLYETDYPLAGPVTVNSGIIVAENQSDKTRVLRITEGNLSPQVLATFNNSYIVNLSGNETLLCYTKQPSQGSRNKTEIYVYWFSTSQEKALTNDNIEDLNPLLGSISGWLAFSKKGEIWIIKTDGKDLKKVIDGDQPLALW